MLDNRSVMQAQRKALAGYCEMTQDQLDGIGATGNTTLLENFIKPADFNECELPCGWKAVYIGCMEPGSIGRVLLIPNHEHTRKVWREGQIKFAVDKGLTLEQAERWISSGVTQRHRFFDHLKDVLMNKTHVDAYLDYDTASDSDTALKWSARWGINDNLPLPRRVLFIQLLKDVLGLNGSQAGDDHRPWEIDHAA